MFFKALEFYFESLLSSTYIYKVFNNFHFGETGKLAIFKAKVIGNPAPTVTWRRAQGEINDPQKFQNKYDPTTNEHTLEVSTGF